MAINENGEITVFFKYCTVFFIRRRYMSDSWISFENSISRHTRFSGFKQSPNDRPGPKQCSILLSCSVSFLFFFLPWFIDWFSSSCFDVTVMISRVYIEDGEVRFPSVMSLAGPIRSCCVLASSNFGSSLKRALWGLITQTMSNTLLKG